MADDGSKFGSGWWLSFGGIVMAFIVQAVALFGWLDEQVGDVQASLTAQIVEQTKDSEEFRARITELDSRFASFVTGDLGDRFTGSQQAAFRELLSAQQGAFRELLDLRFQVMETQDELNSERLRRQIDGCCK